MKTLRRITGIIFLSFILEFPVFSQLFPYAGPGADEAFFFPIGWSEDVKRLSYGMFYSVSNSQIPEDFYYLKIFVQDLVSDTILWQTNKTWTYSEGNYPGTAREAWDILNAETPGGIVSGIVSYEIRVPAYSASFTGESDNQLYTIPYLIGNDEITISVAEEETGDPTEMASSKSYEIHLHSKNLGEKKISEGRIPSYAHVYIRGYVITPNESRIVIVLHKYGHFDHPEFDTSTSEYLVIGGHLRAGFKFMPK